METLSKVRDPADSIHVPTLSNEGAANLLDYKKPSIAAFTAAEVLLVAFSLVTALLKEFISWQAFICRGFVDIGG